MELSNLSTTTIIGLFYLLFLIFNFAIDFAIGSMVNKKDGMGRYWDALCIIPFAIPLFILISFIHSVIVNRRKKNES